MASFCGFQLTCPALVSSSQLEQTVNELEAAAVRMKEVDDEGDNDFDEVRSVLCSSNC